MNSKFRKKCPGNRKFKQKFLIVIEKFVNNHTMILYWRNQSIDLKIKILARDFKELSIL